MAKSSPKHFFSKFASVHCPRSRFDMSFVNTRTMQADYLYPVRAIPVIPGDTWSYSVDSFVRLLSPLDVPMMDNLYCTYHCWFVPWRLVWDYTKNFFGEKRRPDDPDDFTIPTILFDSTAEDVTSSETYNPATTPDAGLPKVKSIYDYFDIPIKGTDNVLTGSFEINALPLRSYNLIFDEWYRDEQRVDYAYANFGNTQDTADKYFLLKRGKRFDYLTASTLEPQLGDPVTIPLGTSAPVVTMSSDTVTGVHPGLSFTTVNNVKPNISGYPKLFALGSSNEIGYTSATYSSGSWQDTLYPSNLAADLRNATPATIATLRNAFQVQAFNEVRIKSGTRYTEFIYGIYSVISPDARLQRPEFLGECTFPLITQPIVQQSETGETPQGTLTAIVSGGTNGQHLFTRSFTEHGYIIIIQNIFGDLTYYQGLDKHWSMSTLYDVPIPMFGNLTDAPIYKKEVVLTGTSQDDETWGYNEIYAPYKYMRNTLNGLVRPNAPLTIGQWSLAQQLPANPGNNAAFITSDTAVKRIVSVTDEDQFIVNHKFTGNVVRELPQYSNPMKWFNV